MDESRDAPDDDTSVLTFSSLQDDPSLPLSWRMHPRYSFSDWKIHIRKAGNSLVDTYYVHRAIICIGPRRSMYLADLINFSSDSIMKSSTTSVAPTAASCVPDLFDFIYGSSRFKLCTENAVRLGYLGQRFMVARLTEMVEQFIQDDVNLGNVGYYISEAVAFQDDLTTSRISSLLATSIVAVVDQQASRQHGVDWVAAISSRVSKSQLWKTVLDVTKTLREKIEEER